MRPDPREPSKQLNAKSLPATKRRAASGVRLSANAEPAASNIKATIANRVGQYRIGCMIRLPVPASLVGPAGELVQISIKHPIMHQEPGWKRALERHHSDLIVVCSDRNTFGKFAAPVTKHICDSTPHGKLRLGDLAQPLQPEPNSRPKTPPRGPAVAGFFLSPEHGTARVRYLAALVPSFAPRVRVLPPRPRSPVRSRPRRGEKWP